jgi:hypothetical protein
MADRFQSGDEIIIKGVITKSDSSCGDIYNTEEKPAKAKKNKFDVRDHISAEGAEVANQAGQTLLQSVATQASSMGMSGCIALGSGVYFQADAVTQNWVEAYTIAEPMVAELVDTGTIQNTIPETSKYYGTTIPKTESFFGKKVGDAKKAQEAYDKLTPEQKALQDDFKKATSSPSPQDDPQGSKI